MQTLCFCVYYTCYIRMNWFIEWKQTTEKMWLFSAIRTSFLKCISKFYTRIIVNCSPRLSQKKERKCVVLSTLTHTQLRNAWMMIMMKTMTMTTSTAMMIQSALKGNIYSMFKKLKKGQDTLKSIRLGYSLHIYIYNNRENVTWNI